MRRVCFVVTGSYMSTVYVVCFSGISAFLPRTTHRTVEALTRSMATTKAVKIILITLMLLDGQIVLVIF